MLQVITDQPRRGNIHHPSKHRKFDLDKSKGILVAHIVVCCIALYCAWSRLFMGGATSSLQSMTTKKSDMAAEMNGRTSFIKETVSNNPVVIFSKTYCPYCDNAKSAIREAGQKVAGFPGAHIVELNTRADGGEIQDALAQMTGRRTVPNVFIGGKPVGGGDETVRYLREGVLPQMLRAAPQQLGAAAAPSAQPVQTVQTMLAVPVAESSRDLVAGKGGVQEESNERIITFGAGCFWGVELAFQRQRGVYKTEVGYSNGSPTPVTYQAVCTGRTGHAEVVRVWYRPEEVSLKDLLAVWEGRHDPTSKDKQGNDRGTQYRSAIFYHDDQQRDVALAWKADAALRLPGKIVTDIAPESGYCPAEGYHQQYLERGGQSSAKGDVSGIRCYG
jgi:peptide-methionine (S)-S-oxide reductase